MVNRSDGRNHYAEIWACRSISLSYYRTHGTIKGYGSHGGTEEKGWILPAAAAQPGTGTTDLWKAIARKVVQPCYSELPSVKNM